MSLLLLRHVHAGDRDAWTGDDRRRPISATGLRQALALVDRYADRPVVGIVSSPYSRCVQSVEPLAAARGLSIEEADELAEGAALDVALRFLRAEARRGERDGGDVVLCSHGDVIGAVITYLAESGAELPAATPTWAKASTWVLASGPDDPAPVHLPPPA